MFLVVQNLLPFLTMLFLTYLACGLYLWVLGIAVFGNCETRRSLFHAPWLGYAVLIGCLQVIHFFAPLDAAVSWTFLGITSIGATGIVIIRLRKPSPSAVETRKVPQLVQLILLLGVAWLVFVPTLNTASQAIVHYDVGYYYLQTIRWITAFPIVPGLGNLFLNLAFNQSPLSCRITV